MAHYKPIHTLSFDEMKMKPNIHKVNASFVREKEIDAILETNFRTLIVRIRCTLEIISNRMKCIYE